jgi:hypothetical protein
LKDYQKYSADTTWSDLFEINEQGLIVLKNFDKTIANLYNGKVNELTTMNAEIESLFTKEPNLKHKATSKDIITNRGRVFKAGVWTDPDGGEDVTEYLDLAEAIYDLDTEEGWKKTVEKLMEYYDISAELADSILHWWTTADPAEKTLDGFKDFLTTLSDGNEELVKYFEDQSRRAQAEFALEKYTSDNFSKAQTIRTLAGTPSIQSLGETAIAYGAITGQPVYKKDENGKIAVDDKNKPIVDYYEYDWDTFFNNFEGISIDSYGEILITDPAAYAASLIETLGETD